ncbi:MAG: sporulation protein [Oscillibacter sp.]|nr:sporulation protein [Oscillibacter sp.]
MERSMEDVYALLRRLGIGANYKGFFPTADAVWLCVQSEDNLTLVTKRLYPEIARKYKTSWGAVERNIRTVAEVVWERNPVLLSKLAGFSLAQRPSATQFLDILTASLLRGSS